MTERIHYLKCWPGFFEKVLSGEKPFEIRRDDRVGGFNVGELLWLREWNQKTRAFTGREVQHRVTYVLRGPGFGIHKGYVVMGLDRRVAQAQAKEVAHAR